MKVFNKELYIKNQKNEILKRANLFDKLYLEIGGKLFDDDHAARCLNGFDPNIKLEILKSLKDDLEIILCIKAQDIESNKKRDALNITYEDELIRLIENLKLLEFNINSVVITLYNKEPSVDKFIRKLKNFNITTYKHTYTKGYPNDIDTIVSEEGYGKNPFIKTTKKIVCVNGAGAGSGKLATCLSQLYHEAKNKINAGYAKYELFPVYNLPLNDPLNLAYEAATANIKDKNMVDFYHLEKYNEMATSYNRDLSTFPILKEILFKIWNKDIYFSPTDMGINTLTTAIIDKKKVDKDASIEIIRRYYNFLSKEKLGYDEEDALNKIKFIMSTLKISDDILPVINESRRLKNLKKTEIVSIDIEGKIISGKDGNLLSAPASMLINALKHLAQIPDEIDLLSPNVLEPVLMINKKKERPLSITEVLIALAIFSVTNPSVKKALDNLDKLNGLNSHTTYILSDDEKKAFNMLNIRVTSDPVFYSKDNQ